MKQFTKQNSSLCSLPGKIDFKSTILFTQKEENFKNLPPQNVVPNKWTLYGILSQFVIEYISLGIVKCTCKFTRTDI